MRNLEKLKDAIECVEANKYNSKTAIRIFAVEVGLLLNAAKAATCAKCLGTGWSYKKTLKFEEYGAQEPCRRCQAWRFHAGLNDLEAERNYLEADLRELLKDKIPDQQVVDDVINATTEFIGRML